MERILIADKSDDVRRTLRIQLAAEGLELSEATDLREALEQLHARPHDVALVAMDLPGGAFAVLDAVKTDPDLARTSVVMLSEDTGDGAVLTALERGAYDCLRRPVDPIEAVVRTRAALRIAALQHRLREGHGHLAHLASTDDLTGILARRYIEAQLRGLVSAAGRHGRPLSVVMLDVDNFKQINDSHGHSVGDLVLRPVADTIRGRTRGEDLLGRWGGDELILVLPDADIEGAVSVAEALRAEIASARISTPAPSGVTVSAGAAAWKPGESATARVVRADLAMSDAKAAGRNHVHASGPGGR